MYRTKPWRVFQLSGHGNPEDERERIMFQLNQGETGFIMEHDGNTADPRCTVPEGKWARGQSTALGEAVLGYGQTGLRDAERAKFKAEGKPR